MAATCTTKKGDTAESVAKKQDEAMASIVHEPKFVDDAQGGYFEVTLPTPLKLSRSPTIRPPSTTKPRSKPAVKPGDYLTPRRTGRAKKKQRTEMPPPAPRLRPQPTPATAVEVLELMKQDAKIIYELTGEGGPEVIDLTVPEVIDLTGDTPDRVEKAHDGDILVTIDGVKLSMNEVFDDLTNI